MIYTLTLNPSLDYRLQTENLRLRTVNRSAGESFRAGGKGINVSGMLSLLGAETVSMGFAGGFAGNEILRLLKADGVEADFVGIKGNSRINVKINDEGDTEINASGPEISADELGKLFEKLEKIKPGDTLVMAGNPHKGARNNIYAETGEKLSGVRIVVDTTGERLLNTLKLKPFLIKPNREELEELFGEKDCTQNRLYDLAKKLKKAGADNVLVSMGKDGAFLVAESGKVYCAEAPELKPVYTVGSGDCAVAGFIYGFDKSGNAAEALKWAVACGSANAAAEGFPTKESVNNFINLINIRETGD